MFTIRFACLTNNICKCGCLLKPQEAQGGCTMNKIDVAAQIQATILAYTLNFYTRDVRILH